MLNALDVVKMDIKIMTVIYDDESLIELFNKRLKEQSVNRNNSVNNLNNQKTDQRGFVSSRKSN